jgi:hypothetical protein
MRSSGFLPAFPALLAAVVLSGCGDPLSLLPARFENRVDTVAIWAATSTSIDKPSGYVISARTRVRLDQVSSFDFVYDVDPAGRSVLLPLGALVNTGTAAGVPGFLKTQTAFDNITLAEQIGYITKDTVVVAPGDIFYVRATLDPNCFLGIPYYAKLQVLAIDAAERAVRFRILSNINCGYRGLQPGLPTK